MLIEFFSISAAETLESKQKALQSHFTWDLDPSRSKLFSLKDFLEDIGTEEGHFWLGPIYNLQGFIQYKLGSSEEARGFFSRATEAFQQVSTADEGPWLVVNYGNLAWLHHHMGENEKSRDFLSKVDALMKKYPSPTEQELHPEVYAEKAWTMMHFDRERELQAAGYLQKAFRMRPDVVQWQTSRVLVLLNASKHESDLEDDIWEDMRVARREDPENLYLAAEALKQRAKRGEQVRDEAKQLAGRMLLNPVGSYSGLKALLRAYREMDAFDEAVDLAEEALRTHPDSRYVKSCAATCYKWRILHSKDRRPVSLDRVERAISLYEEVVPLYPHSNLSKKLSLVSVQEKSAQGLGRSEQMYQELLSNVQDPADQQMLYNGYAKYLYFVQQDGNKSIEYHMKAAAIEIQSFYRQKSIKSLEKIRGRNRRVDEFLNKLRMKV